MAYVTLNQMLDARERRAQRQKALTGRYGLPLISFTLNIPGPEKRSPLTDLAYRYGLSLLERRFHPCHMEKTVEDTGCEALMTVNGEPESIKRACVEIEDADRLGRLFDLDVLDKNGESLGRERLGLAGRKCLVCSDPAHDCARSRKHSVEQLTGRVREIIVHSLDGYVSDLMASQAQRALMYEVCVCPKPGLVDRMGNGAHEDMDIFTFADSISVLFPYFKRCAYLGFTGTDKTPQTLFDHLKAPGEEAEQAMYRATNGVNTHKGAIYSMGIACAAAGRLMGENRTFSAETLGSMCAQMTGEAVRRHFSTLTEENAHTCGERLYIKYGLRGVRGEAADGFPSVTGVGLPVLRNVLGRGFSVEAAARTALIALMTEVPDTVLIGRSSYKEWESLSGELRELIRGANVPENATLETLDRSFSERKLSPGGCADLLALTLFAHFVENIILTL